jgi:hypothetical protein
LTKGFKGPFDKEMVSINERNSAKGIARYFLGMGVWIVVLVVIAVIMIRPAQEKRYKIRTNEKGEMEFRRGSVIHVA